MQTLKPRMAYRVKLMPRAQRDLSGIYDHIAARESDAARTWYFGLKDSIRSLYEIPSRCPQTPEDSSLRHLLYGHKPHIYRVIYRILEKQKIVEVLHIRHGARDEFNPEETP